MLDERDLQASVALPEQLLPAWKARLWERLQNSLVLLMSREHASHGGILDGAGSPRT